MNKPNQSRDSFTSSTSGRTSKRSSTHKRSHPTQMATHSEPRGRSKNRSKSRFKSRHKKYSSTDHAHADCDNQGQPTLNQPNPFTQGGRLTLFGRKPVFETLKDPRITAQKLFIARHAKGEIIAAIIKRAEQLALPIERLSSIALSRISKNGKQDQGVALDVQAPLHLELKNALNTSPLDRPIFLVDGLTTPANLGMVIRSVWASGSTGIILPREGNTPLNPLAVKASSGVAIHAAVWHCQSALDAVKLLTEYNIPIFGLAGEATHSLYGSTWPQRSAWVIGNESVGISDHVRTHLTTAISLPMAGHVESLNAAAAASVVAFELSRQRGEHA